jgi:hypothetical protein
MIDEKRLILLIKSKCSNNQIKKDMPGLNVDNLLDAIRNIIIKKSDTKKKNDCCG